MNIRTTRLAVELSACFGPALMQSIADRFPDGRKLARRVAEAVADPRQRKALLRDPSAVADRVIWVARDLRKSVDQVVECIRGAQDATGIVLKGDTGHVLAPGPVPSR